MGGLQPVDLRQRVEAGLVTALGALVPPWRLSTQPWDLFPGADLQDKEALSFAVGLPSSTPLPVGRQLQAAALHQSRSTLAVRFSSQIRGDAAVADYDLGLQREVILVGVVLDVTGLLGPTNRLETVDRHVVADGTLFVGDCRFVVFHGYPI